MPNKPVPTRTNGYTNQRVETNQQPQEQAPSNGKPELFGNRFSTNFFKKGRARKNGHQDSDDEEDQKPRQGRQQAPPAKPTYGGYWNAKRKNPDNDTDDENAPRKQGFTTAQNLQPNQQRQMKPPGPYQQPQSNANQTPSDNHSYQQPGSRQGNVGTYQKPQQRQYNNQSASPSIGNRSYTHSLSRFGNVGGNTGQTSTSPQKVQPQASFKPPGRVAQAAQPGRQEYGSSGQEEPQHEALRGCDPKLIEIVENNIMDRNPGVTWDDIAGLEFAKKTVNEAIIWPLQRPDLFKGLRTPPKGLLLFGPPGNGKTLIGKAIASEVNATFFCISASSMTSKWVGEGEKLVKVLFGLAVANQPSIVFIDEIDSLLSARNDHEMDCTRRLKTEFLVQLDGAATNPDDRILIVGATNRPQELDEAVRRRLVKRLYIPLPNSIGRKQLLSTLLSREPNTLSDEEMNQIVENTRRYSGADLRALCTEAAMLPLRDISDIRNIMAESLRSLNLQDFLEAIANVRPTVSIDDLDKLKEWNEQFGSFQFSEEDLDN